MLTKTVVLMTEMASGQLSLAFHSCQFESSNPSTKGMKINKSFSFRRSEL